MYAYVDEVQYEICQVFGQNHRCGSCCMHGGAVNRDEHIARHRHRDSYHCEADMATLKVAAMIALVYAILWADYIHILTALTLWEIGTGFRGSIILWFSDSNKDDHGS